MNNCALRYDMQKSREWPKPHPGKANDKTALSAKSAVFVELGEIEAKSRSGRSGSLAGVHGKGIFFDDIIDRSICHQIAIRKGLLWFFQK
jgi:hypothetical protein